MHTCSYFCDRPECVKSQRDELRKLNEALHCELQAFKETNAELVDELKRLRRLNNAQV